MHDAICKISVYMTCYNASPFIEECIKSILNQSFENFELIIVDDGSTDDTVEKINTFRDKRIKPFHNNHNYIESLNLAIEKSQGKYLAKMDADDVMMEDRLLIQYNYMEHHPEIDLLAGGMELFGNRKGFYVPKVKETTVSMKELFEYNVIAHPTVMIRKKSLQNLPYLYKSEYTYAEDYKLWFTMLNHGLKLDNIPDILVRYRINNNQITMTKRQEQKEITDKIKSEYKLNITQ